MYYKLQVKQVKTPQRDWDPCNFSFFGNIIILFLFSLVELQYLFFSIQKWFSINMESNNIQLRTVKN